MQFGRSYEEFEVGATYKHWPGKTVTEFDDHMFCLLTMNHHPLHLDTNYAEETTQFGKNVVVGNYVYSILLGMSVPDISGKAIANLEIESLRHVAPTFHGDTLYGETRVLDKWESKSKDDRGVVHVETIGYNQDGKVVCIFRRKVMVPKDSYLESRGGEQPGRPVPQPDKNWPGPDAAGVSPMPDDELWVVRHGETEWSRDGRHTSRTEVELTPEGEEVARGLADRLAGVEFDLVLTSPRVRARRTAELAGFADAHVEDDLAEWDYGDYEGITTPRSARPCPAGRSGRTPAPAGRTPSRSRDGWTAWSPRCARTAAGCWSSATATPRGVWRPDGWPSRSRRGGCSCWAPATVSVLGYERESPVVARWNS